LIQKKFATPTLTPTNRPSLWRPHIKKCGQRMVLELWAFVGVRMGVAAC